MLDENLKKSIHSTKNTSH